jgi:hypothetical protein
MLFKPGHADEELRAELLPFFPKPRRFELRYSQDALVWYRSAAWTTGNHSFVATCVSPFGPESLAESAISRAANCATAAAR